MLEVLKYPDPRLNLKAVPVTQFDSELKKQVDQMLATMYKEEGCGLASIQVNIQKSIVVLDVTNDYSNTQILINPQIVSESGSQTGEEGCLSFPGLRIKVTRPLELVVKAQDLRGEEFTIHAKDFLAKCIHHECEHLSGEVFIKNLSRLKLHLALKRLEKYKLANAE